MRLVYSVLFYLLLPFIILRLFIKSRKLPEYRKRICERFGYSPFPKLNGSIWIHAVSVGEAVAAMPLVKAFNKEYPNLLIVFTAMTPTGSAQIQTIKNNKIFHMYIPYDYPSALKRFLRHINPKLLIIMETELWPNTLYYCKKNNVKIILANARLSLSSFCGYKKISKFTRKMLSAITLIAAQSQVDAKRFIDLGADSQKVKVVGNFKFDLEFPENLPERIIELRKKIGERLVWVAASTHPGEEEQILNVHKIICEKINALLIIVPRHPERFNDVEKLSRAIFKTTKYSAPDFAAEVVIGDVMGELLLFYGVSDVAFVGGSIAKIGGHNLLEPAMLGKPIITGPNLTNFAEISQLLIQANALKIIQNENELVIQLTDLLKNESLRKELGANALQVFHQNRGVVEKIRDYILKCEVV